MTVSQITVQELHRALGGEITRGKNGPQVLCPGPGHSKQDRSLAVMPASDGDGFVVHSHAGDDAIVCKDHVRRKLGLPSFQPQNGRLSSPTSRKIVRSYDYTDENGEMLFQVVRYEPKDFRQRRPDGAGGWISNLEGVRRVPYRLPELIEALSNERPVFVVEGEKDADALWNQNIPTTCNPAGAGKWRDEYSEHFRDAKVYVIPDNDKPGRDHAQQVMESLTRAGATVRVIDLPGVLDKGDVSDWLKAGGTAEQLYAIAEKPAQAEPLAGWRANVFSAAELRERAFPEISYVTPGLVPEGLSILAGRPKIGKSWLALDMAFAVASEPPSYCMGDREPIHGNVLYAALEDNPRRLQRRIKKILTWSDVPWPERLHLATQWRRLDDGGVDDLREWGESVPGPMLVILDTLAGIRPERRGIESVYDGDYRALSEIHAWANKLGIAVIVLHHTRKLEADDPLDSISGSLGLAGCADTSLVLNRTAQGTTLYLRGRDIEEAEYAVSFDPVTCRWTILGDAAEIHRSETRGKVLAVLQEAKGPLSPAEIAANAAIGRNTIDQMLSRMKQSGEVINTRRGSYVAASRVDLVGGHKNDKNRKKQP
jgi:AAA domain